MSFDKNQFEDILKDFTIDSDELKVIAADFRYDLKKGLKDPEESSLRMLKSYIGLPTRREQGEYLALDFGGTNVRVLLIRLEGDGKFEVLRKVARSRSSCPVPITTSPRTPRRSRCSTSSPVS